MSESFVGNGAGLGGSWQAGERTKRAAGAQAGQKSKRRGLRVGMTDVEGLVDTMIHGRYRGVNYTPIPKNDWLNKSELAFWLVNLVQWTRFMEHKTSR